MDDNSNMSMDLVGISGGIVLSICLIPQIYTVIKTKEVYNISYLWQFMYIVGLSLHLTYGIYYQLIPIYIPCIIELCFIILLTFLKYKYTNYDSKCGTNDIKTVITVKSTEV